jgi:hypothetical protein
MNRLLDPPAIHRAMQRMVCTGCGAEANASCDCGKAYVPKSVQAAEAIRANPEKSNRVIADETGLSEPTVRRARASDDAPATVTGRDGKTYPATKPPTDGPPPNLTAEANKHLDKIVNLLRQMNQRQRLSFRTAALQQMTDAYLDENVIEF